MSAQINLRVDLQLAVVSDSIPDKTDIEHWVASCLQEEYFFRESVPLPVDAEFELTIRVVDKDEIQALNKTYRHKDQPTNVLSFPYEGFDFEVPEEIQLPLLGDLLICHDIVVQEAREQGKTIQEHWAHMVIHGVLHLKGYDHIQDDEAEQMENLEVKVLRHLSFSNPYQ